MNPVRVDGSSLLGPAELWDGVALDWGGDPQLLAFIHGNVTHGTGKAGGENKVCFGQEFTSKKDIQPDR